MALLVTEEAAAIEQRLIHLRDLVEGAKKEITRGTCRGLEDKVRKELEGKVRRWEKESKELHDRRRELEERPIDLTPTPAAKRVRMKPMKVRWNAHDEWGGYAGCIPRGAK